MRAIVMLVALAVVFGAAALYRYESSRAVPCDPNQATLGGVSDTLGAGIFRTACQARIDSKNGEAQGAYIAYGAAVLGGSGAWLAVRRRRKIAAFRYRVGTL